MRILFVPAFLFALMLLSCEKVIDVSLNAAQPRYVIDASLFEGTGYFRVRVTRTTDYFNSQPTDIVTDAVVTIASGTDTAIAVPYLENGWYMLPAYTAVAGETYQLQVLAGGNSFTAAASIPGMIPFDSVRYEYKPSEMFRDEGYEITVFMTDPASVRNFYRLIYSINDTLRNRPNDMYLFNDKFNNGNMVKLGLFERFKAGDSLHFELRTMDEQVFDFFTTLNDAISNGNGPAPANPLSNIKGGALGCFGAYSVTRQSLKLPI